MSRGVRSAREVFSTDFDLYFKHLPPYAPFFNGGAPRWGTYRYNEESPEFPVGSPDSFAEACRERGVRFVVVNDRGRLLAPFFGEMYDGMTPVGPLMPVRRFGGRVVFFILHRIQ
jgi:hypothetical protein